MRDLASTVGVSIAALYSHRLSTHVAVIILRRLLVASVVFINRVRGAVIGVIWGGDHSVVGVIPLVFGGHVCSVDSDGGCGHDCKKQRMVTGAFELLGGFWVAPFFELRRRFIPTTKKNRRSTPTNDKHEAKSCSLEQLLVCLVAASHLPVKHRSHTHNGV